MSIFVVITDSWHLTNGKALRERLAAGTRWENEEEAFPVIAPGRHEMERIPCPVSDSGPTWLVLKGTQTGMAEDAWRRNNATIEEDGVAT